MIRTPHAVTRRDCLRTGLAGATVSGLAWSWLSDTAVALPPARSLTIERIEQTTVKVPFRPVPDRNTAREIPHWKYSEIFQVHLSSGHVGVGETLLFYTWGVTQDEHVRRALGKNAADLMWDDQLGAGLQMALFDAVARAADVPVHRLFGRQVHHRTPLSWWNIDTSPEDMASECRTAYAAGYRAYKTKGRPWFDIWQQMEKATEGLPSSFKIDMDFNDTLLDARRGIPILKDLESWPQTDIYETPIPQFDIGGNQQIRRATRIPIAMHFGKPAAIDAIRQRICDGFVIGRGASRLMKNAAVAEMADMPFWLQLVGTGITAAWSLHFGAVCSHATWPAVNCHQLYVHSLLKEPIRLHEGFVDIPDQPGLGYEVDWDVVERFRVEKPAERPEPERLIEIRWPSGQVMHLANTGRVNFVLDAAREGRMPFFRSGVTTRLLPDDGTARWRSLYEAARKST